MATDTQKYDGEYTTNPALVYYVRPLNKGQQQYAITNEDCKWSAYTYYFAIVYAESGQLKEALFWLNVSVEALVEEFVRSIASTEGMRISIECEEHKFDTSEEILIAQFPEMKGKVKWPNTVIHASVFTKLRRAVQMSDKKAIQKDIMKKYSHVNAKRNSLFHGDSVTLTMEDIDRAFKAYAWLKDNLK